MAAKPEPSEALKAQLAGLVGRLTAELGVGGGRSAEGLATASVAMLSKMISPYAVTKVSVTQSQKALNETAPDPDAFQAQYNKLKTMGVKEVDKYLAVVAKIVGDHDLLNAVTVPRSQMEGDPSPSPQQSPYGMSHDLTLSEASGADVTNLKSMDGFSFNDNPLASDEKSGGRLDTHTNYNKGTPGAKGMRRLGDDFGEEDMRVDMGNYPCEDLKTKISALEIGAPLTPSIDAYQSTNRVLVPGVDFPKLPDWTTDRMNLTGKHLGDTGQGSWSNALVHSTSSNNQYSDSKKQLSEYSAAQQELLILDDLLYCALGIDGRFVRAAVDRSDTEQPADQKKLPSIKFTVDEGLEGSLRQLTSEALPLVRDASVCSWFVESKKNQFQCGLVCHALAAEIEELLHDWRVMITQLEHQRNVGKLSLHSFWFYLRPAAGALGVLTAVAKKTNALRGAELLNALHEECSLRQGDPSAKVLTKRLLQAASTPYLKSIEKWVFQGVVEDPYDEFLVLRDDSLRKESLAEEYNSRYWHQKYSIRDVTPRFLSDETSRKVLTTGKYIDAARESFLGQGNAASTSNRGSKKENFALPPKPRDGLGAPVGLGNGDVYPGSNVFTTRIDDAFKHASESLLHCLLNEVNGDLKNRLRSCKRYFLLNQGDFLVHFVDVASDELGRPASEISIERLQSMLELALKTSTACDDPHADLLRCGLERQPIIAQLLQIGSVSGSDNTTSPYDANAVVPSKELTGMDTFTLDYHAPWPTSLVLSRTSLTKYQLLFRHVFHCKHVERRLCAAWRVRLGKQSGSKGHGAQFGKAHVALQRMLHFISNFVHYVTMEVIEPNWVQFEKSLEEASTVDHVIDAHDFFLDTVMKEGLLFWPRIMKRLDAITKGCVQFADMVAGLDDTDDDNGESIIKQAMAMEDPEFIDSLTQLETTFDTQMRELFQVLSQSAHAEPNLSSLCARLDFNEYYTYGAGGKYA